MTYKREDTSAANPQPKHSRIHNTNIFKAAIADAICLSDYDRVPRGPRWLADTSAVHFSFARLRAHTYCAHFVRVIHAQTRPHFKLYKSGKLHRTSFFFSSPRASYTFDVSSSGNIAFSGVCSGGP